MSMAEPQSEVSADEQLAMWELRPTMPVHIVSSDAEPVKQIAPEFGNCMSYPVSSAIVVQLLPRRLRRSRALIFAGGMSGQTVYCAERPDKVQMQQGIQITGSGQSFEWKSQQPLYAISSAATTTLSVLDESYGDT